MKIRHEPTQREVETVGEALRDECLAIFGSNWSYDNAWRLARAAIRAMDMRCCDRCYARGELHQVDFQERGSVYKWDLCPACTRLLHAFMKEGSGSPGNDPKGPPKFSP